MKFCAACFPQFLTKKIALRLTTKNPHTNSTRRAVPLKIFASTQNGRRYLMGYDRAAKNAAYRLDRIVKIDEGEVSPDFARLGKNLRPSIAQIWGVVCESRKSTALEHVEFTIQIGEGEEHIYQRLIREKRSAHGGAPGHMAPAEFTADVYDSGEMIPWIRTFIGRVFP